MKQAAEIVQRQESNAVRLDRDWDRYCADLGELETDWLWESDAEHRITYISERARRIIGIRIENHIGKRRDRFAPGSADPELVRRHLEDLQAQRPFRDFVYAAETDRGRVFISISGNPIFNEQGRFLGYRGIGTQVTAKVTAEREAEFSFRRMAEAIESLSIGYCHHDAEDRLVMCNTAYKRQYPEIEHILVPGVRFEEHAGAIARLGLIPEAKNRVEAWLEERKRQRREGRSAFERQLPDGRWMLISDYHTPTGDIIGVHQDITELKLREAALRRSEEYFSLAFQISPGMTAISEVATGRHIAVNDKWVETMGYPRESVIGRTATELKVWVDPEARSRAMKILKREGRLRNFEAQYLTARGERRDFLISAEMLPVEGEPQMLIVGDDVTDRKRAEAELRRSEARFSGILKISPEAIIVVDARDRITLFNDGAEVIFGYAAAEILGSPIDILIPAQARAAHGQHMRNFARAPESSRIMGKRGEIRGVRKDGSEFPAEASISKLEIGGELLFTILLHDIGDRKRAEAALLAAKEEAELANRAKSEFLANMSHELRTPLNAILGFSEVIRNEVLGPAGNPKYVEYANDIHGSGEHLLDIISDILDLARIDAGHERLDEEVVDLAETIRGCVRLLQERADAAGVSVRTHGDKAPLMLSGDRRKLKQIFINLLSNAVKFTESGGTVDIALVRDLAGCLVVSVADTGIGMDPADIPKALEAFTRIEGSLTRQREGTGLGLPLVRSLVELHGGWLDIESTLGRGTCVTVRFPGKRTIDADSPVSTLPR